MFIKMFIKMCKKMFTTKKNIAKVEKVIENVDPVLAPETNAVNLTTVSSMVQTDLSGVSICPQECGQKKDVWSLNSIEPCNCCGNIVKLIVDIFSNPKIKEDIAIVEQVIETINPALIPEITAVNILLNEIETAASVINSK